MELWIGLAYGIIIGFFMSIAVMELAKMIFTDCMKKEIKKMRREIEKANEQRTCGRRIG